MVNTEWLRLLSWFSWVWATRRRFWPRHNTSKASSVFLTSTSTHPLTNMFREGSSRRIREVKGLEVPRQIRADWTVIKEKVSECIVTFPHKNNQASLPENSHRGPLNTEDGYGLGGIGTFTQKQQWQRSAILFCLSFTHTRVQTTYSYTNYQQQLRVY